MQYHKIAKLLDTPSDNVPRFITKNGYDQSDSAEDTYKSGKQIRLKTSMLRSDQCDYSDAYIVVKGDAALTKAANKILH